MIGPTVGPAAPTFHQAFIHQMLDVMAAISDGSPLTAPGEEGARSVRLIDACYNMRTLLDMPWMSEKELSSARTFA